jgi:RNA polymerase sigma factor (sigma-70 family)
MTALPEWDIASDAELVSAAAAGDRLAFAGIYDRYADRLHDFCIGMLRDRDGAADCVQDAFCIAATRLTQLADPDKLRPWLYAIARNEALRCIRARRREQVTDELPEAASAEPGPEILAAQSELADLVTQAAGGLSDRDRTVLDLAYRHGLDGPELAAALNVSPGTANRTVSRLRQTVEHSLGALLVARQARAATDACADLLAILAGWDGRFTALIRKRIARHIESCPACEEQRRRLVNPVALLGAAPVLIPAPSWLRERTLHRIGLVAYTTTLRSPPGGPAVGGRAAGGDTPTGAADTRLRPTRRLVLGALLLVLLIGALVLRCGRLEQRDTSVSPAVVSATAPTPAPSAVSPAGSSAYSPPPAPPPTSAETMATTPIITTPQAPPLITRQIVTAQTTAPTPPPAPSVTSSSRPATTPATSIRSVTPPTTSIAHHGNGGGGGTRSGTGAAGRG